MPCKEEEDEVKTYLLTNRKNIILTINNDLKILDMPDTDWEKYITKRPLPTYAERLKEIEKKVHEWKRHKYYRQHGLKKQEVAEQLGITTNNLTNYVNAMEGMNFSAWINSLRIEEAKKIIIKHPEKPISDVGNYVGHKNLAAFKYAFVTVTGQSIEEWIEQNIKKIDTDND